MTCKLYFGMGQTLVLNASYEPLNITSWRRAVILMIKGKAESLEEDKSYLIHNGRKLPTVIRLRYYVKVPFREVSFCLLYTSPSPRDDCPSRMPSSA